MPTAVSKPRSYNFRKRVVVQWAEGEREALIAEALVEGKVTKIDLGVSGHGSTSEDDRITHDQGKALSED